LQSYEIRHALSGIRSTERYPQWGQVTVDSTTIMPSPCGGCGGLAQIQDIAVELARAVEIVHKNADRAQGLENCAHCRIPFDRAAARGYVVP
jgi:hypothetical protein